MTLEDDIKLFTGGKLDEKKTSNADEIPIFEENVEAFLVFVRLGTQWNRVLIGKELILTGLNYSSVETMLRIFKVKNKIDVMSKIQVMESKYLELSRV